MLMLCWGNHHHGVNALGVLIVVGSGAALNGCSDWMLHWGPIVR